jgi:hypothetical protein
MEHNRQPEEIDKARRADAAARSASWRRADKMKQTCNLFGALVLVALAVVAALAVFCVQCCLCAHDCRFEE